MSKRFYIGAVLGLLFSTLASAQIKFDFTSVNASPGASVCRDFVAEDFSEIVNMQFSVNWDPAVIRLDSVSNVNIPEPQNLITNLNLAPSGRIPVIWFDPLGAGISVDDGVVLFSLCFTAIGLPGDCSDFEITDSPLAIDVSDANSMGQNIGIISPATTVCLANQLNLFRENITMGDCNNPEDNAITLIVTGGTFPYTFNWSGPNGFTGTGPVQRMLDNGDYDVTISDASTPPFIITKTYTLNGDFTAPDLVILSPETLDCDNTEINLDASTSSSGSGFDLLWTTNQGNIVSGSNTLTPTIDQTGWYQLSIRNNNNGCESIDSIEVAIDTIAPVAAAIADGNITCIDSVVVLSAQGSSTGNNIEYFWTTPNGQILNGADRPMAEAGAPGNYLLQVRDTNNGCTATTGVVVEDNTLRPLADAGSPIVDCDSLRVFLQVITAGATGLTYNWSTADGLILRDAQTDTPQIGQGGTYVLSALNNLNGCTNVTEVIVDEAIFPQLAVAGENDVACDPSGQLTAALPDNAFGEWTTDSNALIINPLADTTIVNNLSLGNNEFIWTLSTNECPDYDSDTLLIWVENSPQAFNDTMELPYGVASVPFDVTLNDSLSGVGGFDVNILQAPSQGTLTNRGIGLFDFEYPLGTAGNTSFQYQICNSVCPNLCDEAETYLIFQINPLIDTTVQIPNGITPNGDGVNDLLVFPILADNPLEYPSSELLIFNRWGEVVYKVGPYLNDWDGTSYDGKELPQGTYYFILNLELGSQNVFKGDITILK